MKSIQPIGDNILVLPLPKENHERESGIVIVDNTLTKGKVMEVSNEYQDVYQKGDIVIYPESAGVSQYYRSQNCLWLNPVGFPKGHIIGIVSDENEGE